MENVNMSEIITDNTSLVTKKEWKQPEILIVSKDTIQGSVFSGNDGNGISTAS